MNIKPLSDYIIIEQIKHNESDILLPRKWMPKYRKGKIIAIGKGPNNSRENPSQPDVHVGDIVAIGQGIGTEWYLDGKICIFIKPDQILFLVNQNEERNSFFTKES